MQLAQLTLTHSSIRLFPDRWIPSSAAWKLVTDRDGLAEGSHLPGVMDDGEAKVQRGGRLPFLAVRGRPGFCQPLAQDRTRLWSAREKQKRSRQSQGSLS